MVWSYQQTLPPPPVSGTQIKGRSAASPSGANFDTTFSSIDDFNYLHNKSMTTTTAHRQSSMQGLGQVLVVIHSSSLALFCYFNYFHKLCIESDAITRRFAWASLAEVSDGKFLF
ncbi:unnamed protein product [Brassica napus]|uniref:(rape) hypothetical protein n=1 Tax=Brassica napus TaxID=3708 RepID=A0A816KJ48_BRANA|nr:unnamed protein product [Brassica napus]